MYRQLLCKTTVVLLAVSATLLIPELVQADTVDVSIQNSGFDIASSFTANAVVATGCLVFWPNPICIPVTGKLLNCECPGCPPGMTECELAAPVTTILAFAGKQVEVTGCWYDDGFYCQYIGVECIKIYAPPPPPIPALTPYGLAFLALVIVVSVVWVLRKKNVGTVR